VRLAIRRHRPTRWVGQSANRTNRVVRRSFLRSLISSRVLLTPSRRSPRPAHSLAWDEDQPTGCNVRGHVRERFEHGGSRMCTALRGNRAIAERKSMTQHHVACIGEYVPIPSSWVDRTRYRRNTIAPLTRLGFHFANHLRASTIFQTRPLGSEEFGLSRFGFSDRSSSSLCRSVAADGTRPPCDPDLDGLPVRRLVIRLALTGSPLWATMATGPAVDSRSFGEPFDERSRVSLVPTGQAEHFPRRVAWKRMPSIGKPACFSHVDQQVRFALANLFGPGGAAVGVGESPQRCPFGLDFMQKYASIYTRPTFAHLGVTSGGFPVLLVFVSVILARCGGRLGFWLRVRS